jgi:hypothetical protein
VALYNQARGVLGFGFPAPPYYLSLNWRRIETSDRYVHPTSAQQAASNLLAGVLNGAMSIGCHGLKVLEQRYSQKHQATDEHQSIWVGGREQWPKGREH